MTRNITILDELKDYIVSGSIYLAAATCGLASPAVAMWGLLHNVEGDGKDPSPTVTSELLGYDRYNACKRDPSHKGGWDCDIWAKYELNSLNKDYPLPIPDTVRAAVGTAMPQSLEWLIGGIIGAGIFIGQARRKEK